MTKMKFLKIIGLLFIGFFSSCSPPHIARNIHKSYPALDNSIEVTVIKIDENIPFKYEELGTVKLEDSGTTGKKKCTYDALLALAIDEAKKVGGNAIKITESIPPGWRKGGTGYPPVGAVIGVGVRLEYHQCHTLSVLILKTYEENDIQTTP